MCTCPDKGHIPHRWPAKNKAADLRGLPHGRRGSRIRRQKELQGQLRKGGVSRRSEYRRHAHRLNKHRISRPADLPVRPRQQMRTPFGEVRDPRRPRSMRLPSSDGQSRRQARSANSPLGVERPISRKLNAWSKPRHRTQARAGSGGGVGATSRLRSRSCGVSVGSSEDVVY